MTGKRKRAKAKGPVPDAKPKAAMAEKTLPDPLRPRRSATTATATGGPRCRVCFHERRAEFDRQLSVGSVSAASVARAIGVNRSSVTRHVKAHLLPGLIEQLSVDPALAELDPLAELRLLFDRMKRHLVRAEESGNVLAIRLLGSELRQGLELFAKLKALAFATGTEPVTITVDLREGDDGPHLPSPRRAVGQLVGPNADDEEGEFETDPADGAVLV